MSDGTINLPSTDDTDVDNPAANRVKVFVDNSTGQLATKNSTGTVTNYGSGSNTDPDAIHDNVAGEIDAIAEKTTLVDADLVIIEDSQDSNNKKKVQVSNLPASAGTDMDAIHDNVAGEIALVTEKVSPASADLLLIEDSADSNNKKRVQIGNLPTGSDADAIHDNVAGEIALVTEKTSISLNDLVLIEDSEDTNNKKRATVGNILADTHSLEIDWLYDTSATGSDPPTNHFRGDTATRDTWATIYIDIFANESRRLDEFLTQFQGYIIIQSVEDTTEFFLCRTTGDITQSGGGTGWFEIPMERVRDQGTEFNDDDRCKFTFIPYTRIDSVPYVFNLAGGGDSMYMDIGALTSSTRGYRAPFGGVITHVEAEGAGNLSKQFEVQINGTAQLTFSLSSGRYSDSSQSISVAQGDNIQVFISGTGAAVTDSLVALYMRRT